MVEEHGIFMPTNLQNELDPIVVIGLDGASTIFDFEKDFAGSLRCIPMAVRFKLDQCGIKLSLRQWSRFTREDRVRLLEAPCDTPVETMHYRKSLIGLVARRSNEIAKAIDVDPAPPWRDGADVPIDLKAYAATLGITPPTLVQWSDLNILQRFALLKLTRDHHDNINFRPAMIEFGLLIAPAPPAI